MAEGAQHLSEAEYVAAQKKAQADAEATAIKTFTVGMRQLLMDLDSMDVDRDRTLDFYEFKTLIKEREMGVHTLDALHKRFDHLDVDNSGLLDYAEFVAYALRENLHRSKISPELLLKQWDFDGDKKVTRTEFRTAMRTLYGAQMSDAELDHVFKELDYDKTNILEKADLDRRLKRINPLPNGMVQQQLRQLDWRCSPRATAAAAAAVAAALPVRFAASGLPPSPPRSAASCATLAPQRAACRATPCSCSWSERRASRRSRLRRCRCTRNGS